MTRKRQKVGIYRKERKATNFACPNCGSVTMQVTMSSNTAVIKCSGCMLEEKYETNDLSEPVDVYAMLIDDFYKDG